jgi:aspartate/methionine/tyrosine aminotransferase
MADFGELSDRSDEDFAEWLTRDVGVAPVPGSSFYHDPSRGRTTVRFAFCKTMDLLEQAAERLQSVRVVER